ncbi:MAG: hypothetical protein CMI52_02245 [Parcubacteria group bacterium]|nr:hypothetical protein [Parcubacteria group bacterium]|tara:strand:+ start:296 stop:895 length:600 start_codon:yes stop_codon:yes gene_type:complete
MYDRRYSQEVLRDRENDIIMNYDAVDAALFDLLELRSDHHLLEVGCDVGYTQRKFELAVERCVGIDINEFAISQNTGNEAIVMDGTAMTFPDSSFDRAYSSHTIEHIPELLKHFEEIARVLKPGGKYVAVYPWELFRGMAATRAAITLYGNPMRSRDMHVNKLNPKKLDTITKDLPITQTYSTLKFMNTPQWLSVWERN